MSLFTTLIYIQLLCLIEGQYQQIWYDNMDSNNHWSTSGDVIFPYNTDCGYDNSQCARTTTEGYIQRSTPIASYSSIRLQVDVDTWDLEDEDGCRIWYEYDNEGLKVWKTWSGENGIKVFYNDQILDAPSSVSSNPNTFLVRMGNYNGDSDTDRCYFDNVYLRGIPRTPSPTTTTTTTTTAPTPSPTSNPIPAPTSSPTPSPTNNPTPSPTNYPTPSPTTNPTKYNSPTTSPTSTTLAPTNNPTKFPTNMPTVTPTNYPTLTPTYKPTDKPTQLPSSSPTNPPETVTTVAVAEKTETDLLNNEYLLYIIILLCIICILMLVFCICCFYCRGPRKKNKINTQNVGAMEMERVQSITSVNSMQSSSVIHAEPGSGSIDFVNWLTNLGLMEYYNVFAMNGFGGGVIGESVFYSLTNDDLKDMGISKVGHRKLILHQIELDKKELLGQENNNTNVNVQMGPNLPSQPWINVPNIAGIGGSEGQAENIQSHTTKGDDPNDDSQEMSESSAKYQNGWNPTQR